MNRIIIHLSCFLLVISACNDVNKPNDSIVASEQGNIQVKITTSAGEVFEPFNDMGIPTFFNVGNIQLENNADLPTVVLGKRIKSGKNVTIKPIALFSFLKDSIQYEYVLSKPYEINEATLSADYDIFLTKHNNLKVTVEQWFKSQCGSHRCHDFTWKNTYKTLLEID